MIKFFAIIALRALILSVNAQTLSAIPTKELFGKFDLEGQSRDFEKDMNAEFLFSKASFLSVLLLRRMDQ